MNIPDQVRNELSKIKEAFASLERPLNLDIAGEYIRQLEDVFHYEEERNNRIEAKSTNILGAAGVVGTLLVGIVSIIFNITEIENCAVFIACIILFLLSFASIILAIGYSISTLKIKTFSYPCSAKDIRKSLSAPKELAGIRMERIKDLLTSIAINTEVINRKVDNARRALFSFMASLSLLFINALVIGAYLIEKNI